MSPLKSFMSGLLVADEQHMSFEILDDNAKVPSESQLIIAYDSGCSSSEENSDDDGEVSNALLSRNHTPMHLPTEEKRNNKSKRSPKANRKPLLLAMTGESTPKRQSRWETSTVQPKKEAFLMTPKRCLSPKRYEKGATDMGLQMPLRSLARPSTFAFGGNNAPPYSKEITHDRLLSTFDLVEEAISVCAESPLMMAM